MKKIFLRAAALLVLSVTVLSLPSCHRGRSSSSGDNDSIPPLGFWTDSFEVDEGKVEAGQFFTNLLTDLGMSKAAASELGVASDTVFDAQSLRAGNSYQAYYSKEASPNSQMYIKGSLQYLVYEEDQVNTTVFQCTKPYRAWRITKPVDVQRRYSDVTIKTSLWNDMTQAGISPQLILDLSEIYAWTVDFFGLQDGDRFRVLYDQEVCEGEIISVDSVYYAVFSHDGKDFQAIYFDQGDKGNLYWNENGESLRKAFLKAPLKFNRISSGFSYARKHPVTGRVRPHTGVDYAAPVGTPVMSIGDGTVISAGWGGGGGNTIKVRHNSVYSTAYLHLSRYAKGIRAGRRVRQGEVIGYVGRTGMATGPHLDFRVWKNGTPINPLKMESPKADPLRSSNRRAFDSVYVSYLHQIDSISKGPVQMDSLKSRSSQR